MNFILAGVLFSIGYMIGMSPIRLNVDNLGGKKSSQVVVADVISGSAAAGLDCKAAI